MPVEHIPVKQDTDFGRYKRYAGTSHSGDVLIVVYVRKDHGFWPSNVSLKY